MSSYNTHLWCWQVGRVGLAVLAACYRSFREERFAEETPWEGYIEQAAISGLNQSWISKTIGMWYAHVTGTKAHPAGPSKIFLKISIYDDQTLYHANREMFTTPQKRAAEHSWRLGPESNMYVMTSLHLQHILTQL